MNKFLHIAFALLCVILVSSCSKDNDDTTKAEQEAYKAAQWAAFEAKSTDPAYVKWENPAGMYYVYAKKIKEGRGPKVYFNSRVSMYYKGTLTTGTEFDSCLEENRAPFKCAVSSNYANTTYGSVIPGWGVALQYMREGDKYEVWIPQELAYGATDQTSIPAYSTLIFEMEVFSVDEQAVAPTT